MLILLSIAGAYHAAHKIVSGLLAQDGHLVTQAKSDAVPPTTRWRGVSCVPTAIGVVTVLRALGLHVVIFTNGATHRRTPH